MITGKPDCIIQTGASIYIYDWKTSKKENKSWRLQSAAYRYLCEVNDFENVQDVIFVKLDSKGGKAKVYQYETYDEDIETFKKCLELYRWFGMDKTRRKI